MHRLNALGTNSKVSDALSSLFLLNNKNVDNAQGIYIIAAAVPTTAGISPRLSTDAFIAAVSYEAVASVVSLSDALPVLSSSDNQHVSGPNTSMAALNPRGE